MAGATLMPQQKIENQSEAHCGQRHARKRNETHQTHQWPAEFIWSRVRCRSWRKGHFVGIGKHIKARMEIDKNNAVNSCGCGGDGGASPRLPCSGLCTVCAVQLLFALLVQNRNVGLKLVQNSGVCGKAADDSSQVLWVHQSAS